VGLCEPLKVHASNGRPLAFSSVKARAAIQGYRITNYDGEHAYQGQVTITMLEQSSVRKSKMSLKSFNVWSGLCRIRIYCLSMPLFGFLCMTPCGDACFESGCEGWSALDAVLSEAHSFGPPLEKGLCSCAFGCVEKS